MKHRIFALFLVLCIFGTGVALAGFGGPQNETGDEEELPPVGDWGEDEWGGTDSGIWTSEMTIGPGMPGEGMPGEIASDTTFGMYPWAPSPAISGPQPAESPIGGYVTSYESTTGAYYSMVAPPAAERSVLLSYNVETAPPTAVYYMGSYMPWGSFAVTFPGTSPMFWISTPAGWSWYAVCPYRGWVRELMYIPTTGTLKVYEIYPRGTTRMYNYGWASPGYRYIWFYGDVPGRHIAIFTVSDRPSNAVTVDVV